MSIFASINGRIFPEAEARVSVLDTGFGYGDAVYETLRTYGRRPFHVDRHLLRLRASAGRIGIEIPLDDKALAWQLDELLARTETESFARLMVTRGVGDLSYHFERIHGPTIVMIAKPLEPPPESYYSEGVPIAIVSVRRNHPQAIDPAIKACNLLNNVLAVREAQSKGAVEGIMLNDRGEVAEGASSNLFIVRHGALITPPLSAGILAGITRAVVLELAHTVGLTAHEETLHVDGLFAASEVFIASSIRELVPVRTIDGNVVGSGLPGPLTLKLLDAYRRYAWGPARSAAVAS
jgi:branched-chain amino acid aminotransferase